MAAVLRRVAKWLGVALLALVVLFAALIALVKHQEAAYEKRAVPFLAVIMSDLATWDYSAILPHFAEPVASAIPEEGGRALSHALSHLGELLRYDTPDLRSVHAGAIVELPLQRGFYVMSDTPCGEASNATLMLIRRAGMNWARSACDFEAIEQAGPTSYRASLACVDIQRGEVESWTVLVEIPDATQFSYRSEDGDDRTRYRHCEQSSLPGPWRDNDISDLVGEGLER